MRFLGDTIVWSKALNSSEVSSGSSGNETRKVGQGSGAQHRAVSSRSEPGQHWHPHRRCQHKAPVSIVQPEYWLAGHPCLRTNSGFPRHSCAERRALCVRCAATAEHQLRHTSRPVLTTGALSGRESNSFHHQPPPLHPLVDYTPPTQEFAFL